MASESVVGTPRPRRALNLLQYSPNGKDLAGVTSTQSLSAQLSGKQQLTVNAYDGKLKKRTSISLPDICSLNSGLSPACVAPTTSSELSQCVNHSATSTPNTSKTRTPFLSGKKCAAASGKSTSSGGTACSHLATKKNISVIMEEKENPNAWLTQQQSGDAEAAADEQSTVSVVATPICKAAAVAAKSQVHVAVQCNRGDEDMVFGETVDGTDYWRLIAQKRAQALRDTLKENEELNVQLTDLSEANESLRTRNAQLRDMLKQYEEIQKEMLEAIDSGVTAADDDQDSGYDNVSCANQTHQQPAE